MALYYSNFLGYYSYFIYTIWYNNKNIFPCSWHRCNLRAHFLLFANTIGHEIGHLKHHDGLRRSLASAWISIFATGGEIITFIGTNLVLKNESARPSLFTVCASIFLVGFGLFFKGLSKIASALYFHLSRKQEYDADDIGAQLTHPNHMKSALAKIEDLNKALVEKEMQQLPFPDLWQVKPKKLSIIDRLWTTHPPTEERIARQAELASFI
jgi:heat shock protein HtpX